MYGMHPDAQTKQDGRIDVTVEITSKKCYTAMEREVLYSADFEQIYIGGAYSCVYRGV